MNQLLKLTLLISGLLVSHSVAAQTCRVDSEHSWLHVLVYRGGILSIAGHNHVIEQRNIQGEFKLEPGKLATASFSLQLKVNDFVVDNTAARTQYGKAFEKSVSEKDKAGTRKNMLSSKFLDAEQFPTIRLTAESVEALDDGWQADVAVEVKQATFHLPFIAHVEQKDQQLMVEGMASISQKALGLKPFSILGVLKVKDQLNLHYSIKALCN